jgi:hypothetical protein
MSGQKHVTTAVLSFPSFPFLSFPYPCPLLNLKGPCPRETRGQTGSQPNIKGTASMRRKSLPESASTAQNSNIHVRNCKPRNLATHHRKAILQALWPRPKTRRLKDARPATVRTVCSFSHLSSRAEISLSVLFSSASSFLPRVNPELRQFLPFFEEEHKDGLKQFDTGVMEQGCAGY